MHPHFILRPLNVPLPVAQAPAALGARTSKKDRPLLEGLLDFIWGSFGVGGFLRGLLSLDPLDSDFPPSENQDPQLGPKELRPELASAPCRRRSACHPLLPRWGAEGRPRCLYLCRRDRS